MFLRRRRHRIDIECYKVSSLFRKNTPYLILISKPVSFCLRHDLSQDAGRRDIQSVGGDIDPYLQPFFPSLPGLLRPSRASSVHPRPTSLQASFVPPRHPSSLPGHCRLCQACSVPPRSSKEAWEGRMRSGRDGRGLGGTEGA